MASSTLLYTDIDFGGLRDTFSKPEKNRSFGYSIRKAKDPLRFQAGLTEEARPRLKKLLKGSESGICLSLHNDQQIAFWKELESQIIATMQANNKEWFGKELAKADLERMFENIVMWNKRHPTVSLRLPSSTRYYVYENGKARQTTQKESLLKPDTEMIPILKLEGMWVTKNQFGAVLRLTDLLIYKNADREIVGTHTFIINDKPDDLAPTHFDDDEAEDALTDDEASWETRAVHARVERRRDT